MMDYNDFQVLREWRNIDLLAVSEENKFIVVIENKVLSKESKHQLEKYSSIINKEYPGYKKLFVFLTPEGEAPSDQINWATFTYVHVLEILEKVIDLRKNFINTRVMQFLDQCIEVLRRYFMGEKELEKLCREIYFKHQKALDLIFEYKPDTTLEISDYLQTLVEDHENLVPDVSSKSYTRFITNVLDEIIPKKGKGWTKTRRILLWEFQNRQDRLILKLIIGPGDQEIRQQLHQIATSIRAAFSELSHTEQQIIQLRYLSLSFEIDFEIAKFLNLDFQQFKIHKMEALYSLYCGLISPTEPNYNYQYTLIPIEHKKWCYKGILGMGVHKIV
ncbi:hypothetical protein BTR23_22155 [Alkalihalophilus pseudofirmus]|nr:hypothetical protein BTR23_22155 [Alkalihalophilus pseudofirmus]